MRINLTESAVAKILWAGEPLRPKGLRARGNAPLTISHVPAPVSANLSSTGILSWNWMGETDSKGTLRFELKGRKITATLAESFAGLADADQETIRRFAAHWGPLRYPGSSAEPTVTEHVEQWRTFAVLARALLRCAVALGNSQSGLADDWRAILRWIDGDTQQIPRGQAGLYSVASALNRWYGRSFANALVAVPKAKIVIHPSSGSLFGILGIQLARLITGAQEGLVCYHCHRFYTPKNRPRTGARQFCPTCRRAGKPQMYAMRDQRARRKQQA